MGMTNKKAAAMAEVLKAYSEGKEIEYRSPLNATWLKTKDHNFNFAVFEYRVTPAPRVMYVNFYENGHNVMHTTPEAASKSAGSSATEVAVKFVEVLE